MRTWSHFVGSAQWALVGAVIVVTGAGCYDHSHIPDADRAILIEREGTAAFLKQSMYAGEFYDDDRYVLVAPRRFEELTFLLTVEGDPILPPPATEIIPAGTRVVIERVEFPSSGRVLTRPIFTPRYSTWVWLRVAQYRGAADHPDRPRSHILVLPDGVANIETMQAWFDAYLTTEDPNPWLDGLDDDMRKGIFKKQARIGMDNDMVVAALGVPDTVKREAEPRDGHAAPGPLREVALYGAATVVLEDGIVTRVSDPYADASR